MAATRMKLENPPDCADTPERGYAEVRRQTESLCVPLAIEDYVIQSSPDASPVKWHLAHTTWFFETFLLQPFFPGYRPFHARFGYLFNSYYETVGSFFPRLQRGTLSRPTVQEIYGYRKHVDVHMAELLARPDSRGGAEIDSRTELGIHHEQQHQELLLTDIKNAFGTNPLRPVYLQHSGARNLRARPREWLAFKAGMRGIGHGAKGFAFDNESPRHRVYLGEFEIASTPVSNGEYLEFIEAGGYRQPELWLSEGWKTVGERGWEAPLYWERIDSAWQHYTLSGMRSVDESEPVCHVSFYEADAFARWAGARLPTEQEWETAAGVFNIEGNFFDSGRLHPAAAAEDHRSCQFFGDIWEWTRSAYEPYPGYRPDAGSLGEYNGKFMCNQLVLRGGSCASPASHIRPTYRNFFYAPDRWQFTGIRLAR